MGHHLQAAQAAGDPLLGRYVRDSTSHLQTAPAVGLTAAVSIRAHGVMPGDCSSYVTAAMALLSNACMSPCRGLCTRHAERAVGESLSL